MAHFQAEEDFLFFIFNLDINWNALAKFLLDKENRQKEYLAKLCAEEKILKGQFKYPRVEDSIQISFVLPLGVCPRAALGTLPKCSVSDMLLLSSTSRMGSLSPAPTLPGSSCWAPVYRHVGELGHFTGVGEFPFLKASQGAAVVTAWQGQHLS